MGGGGKKSTRVPVVEFRMTLHMGVGMSVDSVNALYYGEKQVWRGSVTENSAVDIYLPEFQGGPLKEGGLDGLAFVMLGGATQTFHSGLAQKFNGRTSSTMPGFRGTTTIFFTGALAPEDAGDFGGERADTPTVIDFTDGILNLRVDGYNGFVWANNNPYMKNVWVEVTRIPRNLNDATAEIIHTQAIGSNSVALEIVDANPAEIIYEIYTNEDWGVGEPTVSMDTDAFIEVAQTLFDEDFGLSFNWTRQVQIEELIAEILSHIQCVIFLHPRTGLITPKLLRDDYTVSELPIFNEQNSKLSGVERKLFGEIVNEVQVKFTNPSNEKPESVTIQDLGAVFAQGNRVVSTTQNYYAIRNRPLATIVCKRDLRSHTTPLATATIEMDRSAWDITPGAVVRVTNEEHCFNETVFRILEVDYGKVGDSTIRCNAIEDIFGYDPGDYYEPAEPVDLDEPETPEPVEYSYTTDMPAFIVGASLPDFEVPDTGVLVLATSDQADAQSYYLAVEQTDLAGNTSYVNQGTPRPLLSRGSLGAALVQEVSTVGYTYGDLVGRLLPRMNSFLIIGEEDEVDQEVVFVYGRSGGNISMRRGCLDTTPKEWPIGTPFWVLSQQTMCADTVVRADADVINYRARTVTTDGVLPTADAPIITHTAALRALRPNRPANCAVNGVLFGIGVDAVDVRDDSNSGGAIVCTWANRNRLLENATVSLWNDATMVLEAGQTTIIRVRSLTTDLVLAEYTGLSGTTHTLTSADFDGEPIGAVEFWSELDGLESLQAHVIHVIVDNVGWSASWGNGWGSGA